MVQGGGKYLTTFGWTTYRRECSTHRTLKAARAAAKKCEKCGGKKHQIWRLV